MWLANGTRYFVQNDLSHTRDTHRHRHIQHTSYNAPIEFDLMSLNSARNLHTFVLRSFHFILTLMSSSLGNPFRSIHGNSDGDTTASAASAASATSAAAISSNGGGSGSNGGGANDIAFDKRYVISSLHELYITRTNLTAITSTDFQLYPSLEHLHLTENHVQRIASYAFRKLNSLLTLDMSVNELEHLPRDCLRGLIQLQRLNLSLNSIRELDEFTIELKNLEILDISHNQLDRIDRNTFQHLHALLDLRLTGNRLRIITVDSFRFLNNLIKLDVRGNHFKEIPLEVLNLLETHLQTLHIERKFTATEFNGNAHCRLYSYNLIETDNFRIHFLSFEMQIIRTTVHARRNRYGTGSAIIRKFCNRVNASFGVNIQRHCEVGRSAK